jgi:hypothetical protein
MLGDRGDDAQTSGQGLRAQHILPPRLYEGAAGG